MINAVSARGEKAELLACTCCAAEKAGLPQGPVVELLSGIAQGPIAAGYVGRIASGDFNPVSARLRFVLWRPAACMNSWTLIAATHATSYESVDARPESRTHASQCSQLRRRLHGLQGGFTVDLALKDVGHMRALGRDLACPLPLADLASNHLSTTKACHGGALDWGAIALAVRAAAGLPPPGSAGASAQEGQGA